jgi:hypothetical protein
MISDRQNQAWIVASAAQFMADNEIEAVNSDVIDFVLEEFTPKEEVPNELIAVVIDNLEAELEKVIG